MSQAPETQATAAPARTTVNNRNDGKGHNMSHPGGQGKMSIFRGVKAFKAHAQITLVSFAKEARDGAHRKAVESYRTALILEDPDAEEMKKRLEAVTVSGTVTSGIRKEAAEEGRFNHNGILQVDIDGVENPGQIRDMIASDPHIPFASVSPSDDGVKAFMFIPVCKSRDEHLAAFAAMQGYMKKTYDITIDASTSDTARLCFVLYDPQAKWNAAAVPLVIPEPQAAPPQAAKPKVDTPAPREDDGFSLAETAEDVRALLAAIPPRPEYMEWLTVCSSVWDALGEIEGTPLLQEWSPEESPGEYASKFKDRLKDVHAGTLVSIAKANGFDTRRAAAAKHAERDGPSPRMKGPWDKQAAPGDGGKAPPSPESFRDMLAARAFDASNPPTQPVPVIKLGGKCIATVGNVMAVQAGIKSGKTATVGAILAAFVIGDGSGEHDTLGFTAANPEGHCVLHFDTEQSRYDHDGVIRRALARVGRSEPPEWFQSFCLTDLSQKDRMRAIETTIENAVATFGGVRAVLLDGVADFMRDPNDAEEAFALVDKLHALAITHGCTIPCVIHENPGSDKTRGHLGSQLARKAETNLRLHKDPATGITTIWADYARHCHIPKDAGTCFAWCDTVGRHVSKGTAGAIKASIKTEKFREEAEKAFGDEDALGYSALVAAIMAAVEITIKTAEKRVVTYQAEGIVRKDASGSYRLK